MVNKSEQRKDKKKRDHLQVHSIEKELQIINNSAICKQIKYSGLETIIMISLHENAELNFV